MFRNIIFLGFILLSLSARGEEGGSCTLEFQMEGVIGPANLDFFQRAQKRAQSKSCDSILIHINTPGGSLQTTRLLVSEILNSPIPVLCLVSPQGAHAGSAGAIILLACHVNGALEATNIGASTPVSQQGDLPSDLRKKIINDTRSWVEGLTRLRGRSEKFGQEIVLEAKAVEASQAFKLGAIDHLAKDRADFLNFANGRSVKMSGTEVRTVKVGSLVTFKKDFRYQLMDLVASPETAYLLLMGSLALLYFEITHPGMIIPGVVGGIGLILSFISLHKLDVMWGGLALILLGLALMVAEAFVASFGILGIGGTVAFVVGSIFLFDFESTGYQLPMALILPSAIGLGAITFLIATMAFRTRHLRPHGGFDDMIGEEGQVVELDPHNRKEGLMDIKGETWKFRSAHEVQPRDIVVVKGHHGLTLEVIKKEQV